MKNKIIEPFIQIAAIVLSVSFYAACTLDTMGCGAPPDVYFPDGLEDAQPEAALPESATEPQPETGPEPQPEAGPEPQPEAGQEPQPEPQPEAGPEPQPEAGPDAIADAPEEPITGTCATLGHDGTVMVHPEMTLGPSAYLTVFGALAYPADAGTASMPFEGWCWSQQGGQGTFACFPKANGNEAPATPKTQVTVQLGTTTSGSSGPPNFYFCDFGVCPVAITFCAGKIEACVYNNGPVKGNVVYKEPGHNGKGELICTLP